MSFTSDIGATDSTFDNEIFGAGAAVLPYHLFSGLYKIQSAKTNDTLFVDINYPSYVTIDVEIPNPFIETALIGEDPVTLDQQI